MTHDEPEVGWIILTTGSRPEQLERAVRSVVRQRRPGEIVVFVNDSDLESTRTVLADLADVVVSGGQRNLGVPGGRAAALSSLGSKIGLVGFLDDDAELLGDDVNDRVVQEFSRCRLGAVTLRLVDEDGRTARRHVPRIGNGSAQYSGDVVNFLGGASVIRRAAYEDTGGFWPELWYGHEELDLAWRLADRDWGVRYLADVEVFHPHSQISRHADGWRLTGRNRVMVARRNLPAPVVLLHTITWLFVGTWRAPTSCRGTYVRGWRSGWRESVERRPIAWRTVWRLTKLGRPPLF